MCRFQLKPLKQSRRVQPERAQPGLDARLLPLAREPQPDLENDLRMRWDDLTDADFLAADLHGARLPGARVRVVHFRTAMQQLLHRFPIHLRVRICRVAVKEDFLGRERSQSPRASRPARKTQGQTPLHTQLTEYIHVKRLFSEY